MQENREITISRAIYHTIKTQIDFGVYKIGDKLPGLEEAYKHFAVSIDTMRSAYHLLKQDGYIRLKKNSGGIVIISFSPEDIVENIRSYFAQRREYMLDACASLCPLFGNARRLGYSNASPEKIASLEALVHSEPSEFARIEIRHIFNVYSSLGNALIMRLIWQIYMYQIAPFVSVAENARALATENSQSELLELRKREDWKELRIKINQTMDHYAATVRKFYDEKIHYYTDGGIKPQMPLHIRPQFCYSLGTELLIDIGKKKFAIGSYLPSLLKMAADYGVSVSTIRRTLALLNGIGITESINGVGTRVLSPQESAKRCDFANPLVQKRLVEFAESLQILALSCKAVAELALPRADEDGVAALEKRLKDILEWGQPNYATYSCLDALARFCPLETVCEYYRELLNILFWGYPIRGMRGSKKQMRAFYTPYVHELLRYLETNDSARFAEILEELLISEFRFTVQHLKKRKVTGIEKLTVL